MNANVLQQCLTIYLRQPSCRKIVLHDYHNKNTYKASVLAPAGSPRSKRGSGGAILRGRTQRRPGVVIAALRNRRGLRLHPLGLPPRARRHLQLQDVTVPPGQSVLRAGSGWHLDRSTWPTPAETLKKSNFVIRYCTTILFVIWSFHDPKKEADRGQGLVNRRDERLGAECATRLRHYHSGPR